MTAHSEWHECSTDPCCRAWPCIWRWRCGHGVRVCRYPCRNPTPREKDNKYSTKVQRASYVYMQWKSTMYTYDDKLQTHCTKLTLMVFCKTVSKVYSWTTATNNTAICSTAVCSLWEFCRWSHWRSWIHWTGSTTLLQCVLLGSVSAGEKWRRKK